jgi:superfamily II DNA or RNA helicase
LDVIPRLLTSAINLPSEAGIQDVFRQLAGDLKRTDALAADIVDAYREGRKVLVLTERTEHLEGIKAALGNAVDTLFILHGRMSRKQRAELIDALVALPDDAPRVMLATGRLVGEGFDHPPLDTLILAMPISWKGTLQQYAGRLHRAHATKVDVRIYDYVDTVHPALMRMWGKRQRGYRAMGYRIAEPGRELFRSSANLA